MHKDAGAIIIWKLGSGLNFQIRGGKLEWNDNNIPEPTNEEIKQWDAEKLSSESLEDQNKKCIQLLNESEIHVSNDPPYPDDVTQWVIVRQQWRNIVRGTELTIIPNKLFQQE